MKIIIIFIVLVVNRIVLCMDSQEYARISSFLANGQLPPVSETSGSYAKRSNWTRQASKFELRDGKLFRDNKPVLRCKDQEQAFLEHHCCNSAGKTFKTITEKYYYRGHKKWIE